MNIVFFGSFQHYSALILKSLIEAKDVDVVGVVTTPPMPVGRKQIITQTPVHSLADQNSIPVMTPEDLHDEHAQPDAFRQSSMRSGKSEGKKINFFITAGYGKILPKSWLDYPQNDSLNLHFSLLPAYRGANPAEWAIMCDETKTGITLIKMSQKLDGGDIIEQRELPISPTDTRETLYQKLYQLGADMLPTWLLEWQKFTLRKQPLQSPTPYAALLKRDDGFLPWPTIQKYLNHQKLDISDFPSLHLQTALKFSLGTNHQSLTTFLSSLPRALATYPSLWTIIPTQKGDKRMKILDFKPFTVQIEGKQPSLFNQIKNQIL